MTREERRHLLGQARRKVVRSERLLFWTLVIIYLLVGVGLVVALSSSLLIGAPILSLASILLSTVPNWLRKRVQAARASEFDEITRFSNQTGDLP